MIPNYKSTFFFFLIWIQSVQFIFLRKLTYKTFIAICESMLLCILLLIIYIKCWFNIFRVRTDVQFVLSFRTLLVMFILLNHLYDIKFYKQQSAALCPIACIEPLLVLFKVRFKPCYNENRHHPQLPSQHNTPVLSVWKKSCSTIYSCCRVHIVFIAIVVAVGFKPL